MSLSPNTPIPFEPLLAAYRSGQLSPDNIRLTETVEAPRAEDILDLSQLDVSQKQQLIELGQTAVARGEVAAIVLAGGMATRFDYSAPKGLFPIVGEHSFLEIKIRALCGQGIHLFLMTSFHTYQPLLDFLEAQDYFGFRDLVSLFQQFKLPRIYANGEIRRVNGEIDYATSGHGDFVAALKQSQLLDQFLAKGGKWLLFSNIDNLGASFDPLLLGQHIQSGVDMSIEVAAKAPGDKGGAPARVSGRLQLVEEFLFPENFDQNQIQVFNTASYIFSAQALQADYDLPWYIVNKKVDGESVLQFEHLAGDLSCSMPLQCLFVDRDQRFLPVKQLTDAPKVEPLIRQKYQQLFEGQS